MLRRASLVLTYLTLGCDYGGSEATSQGYACGEPRESTVDTGAELELEAGDGVGLLIEYLGEGQWRTRASCDTPSSGYDCYWDVLVWPHDEVEFSDFTAEGLEAGDSVSREWDGALHLTWMTGADFDGVTFGATPGGALRFDALLDGYCAHPYIYWVGDGAVHTGSPSNPLDLTPTEP
jgi:hypothetical protein